MGGKFSLAERMQQPPAQGQRTIEDVTREFLNHRDRAGAAVLEMGRLLKEAKALLSHGEWLSWLKERIDFSERSAQVYMQLHEVYGSNPQPVTDLGMRKARALMALTSAEERDDFISSPHLVGGEEKTVIDMSARELERALREREEALAQRDAAEASRRKMEADMRLANSRLSAMDAEIRAKSDAAKEAERHAGALRQELEALKARPVEIPGAVVLDEAALAATTEFQVHFTAAGQEVNCLLDCLQRLREAGAVELHNRLSAALAALGRQLLNSIPEQME